MTPKQSLKRDIEIMQDHLSVCMLILNRYPKGMAYTFLSEALTVVEKLDIAHFCTDRTASAGQAISIDQTMIYQNQLTVLLGEFIKTDNIFAKALVQQLIAEVEIDLLIGEVPDVKSN